MSLRDKMGETIMMEAKRSPYIKHIFVCVNTRDPGVTCCGLGGTPPMQAAGHEAGEAIRQKLKAYVKEYGLKGKVRISSSGCLDLCAQGPNVMVYPDYRWYSQVSLADVDEIIREHLAPLTGAVSTGEPGASLCEGGPRHDGTMGSCHDGTMGPCHDGAVRAFLFDLGNVLVRFDHRLAADKIAPFTRVSAEEILRLLFESQLLVDHDEGRISTQQFYEGLKEKIRISLGFEKFLALWNDIFSPNEEMESLVRKLLPRYPCYLISNTNRAHFESIRKRFPMVDLFQGWILSYEVGHLKPHPAIYQRALQMARVPPNQILYVDDREDLIEAARRIGFQVHRFTSAQVLKGLLKNF